MSGDPKQDQAETRAVQELSAALTEAFRAGGTLDGYGFALWIIPPKAPDGGSVALISNTPRPRVAEIVAGWMLRSGFAAAIPCPPNDAPKPN